MLGFSYYPVVLFKMVLILLLPKRSATIPLEKTEKTQICTKSKDCVKTVTRHIWKDYEELADDARYTPIYQRMYKARKETIERVFADAKEQRGLRYTRYTGLAQVTNWVKLKFAAMNLKKYAKWVWRDTYPDCFFCIISLVSHFSEQTPVLFDAELGFVDTLRHRLWRSLFCCLKVDSNPSKLW